MRNSIVEGEPGIFPDPIARVLVAVSRWVRRRDRKAEPPAESPAAPPAAAAPGPPGDDDSG